jgi:hypothetical protein
MAERTEGGEGADVSRTCGDRPDRDWTVIPRRESVSEIDRGVSGRR